MKRYAIVRGRNLTIDKVAVCLPRNYKVAGIFLQEPYPGGKMENVVVIEGRDDHGWTLDSYVIPRLGSGCMRCEEIDLSHPIMLEIEQCGK